MKFTPEVLAAIQTLKDAAENDFEKHRIEVLERDLQFPPVVEVIDDTHQKFNGVIYQENKKGRFQTSNLIHRIIYSYYYGEINQELVIHHIDGNPANNEISNLQALSRNEHLLVHGYPLLTVTCPTCGKIFQSKRKNAKFCSISCAAKNQYNGHSVDKICPVCGKSFHTRNSKNQKCCSKQCYARFRKISNPKICPICGKIIKRKTGAKCCSRTCGGKLAWQTRREKSITDKTLAAFNVDGVSTATDLVSAFSDNPAS